MKNLITILFFFLSIILSDTNIEKNIHIEVKPISISTKKKFKSLSLKTITELSILCKYRNLNDKTIKSFKVEINSYDKEGHLLVSEEKSNLKKISHKINPYKSKNIIIKELYDLKSSNKYDINNIYKTKLRIIETEYLDGSINYNYSKFFEIKRVPVLKKLGGILGGILLFTITTGIIVENQ